MYNFLGSFKYSEYKVFETFLVDKIADIDKRIAYVTQKITYLNEEITASTIKAGNMGITIDWQTAVNNEIYTDTSNPYRKINQDAEMAMKIWNLKSNVLDDIKFLESYEQKLYRLNLKREQLTQYKLSLITLKENYQTIFEEIEDMFNDTEKYKFLIKD
ncbi:MAG: hypothetical protein WC783_02605 [Candidatus Paceibacterota bacterium]|jgi:hypothetical protein